MSKIDTPAALLKDLDVDKMVDTTLAKNYFKKHNFEFRPVGPVIDASREWFVLDRQENKIFGGMVNSTDGTREKQDPADKRKLLLTIASEVESNAELFAQIAYLTRNSKMDDIKKYDIKVIANQFRCFAAEASETWPSDSADKTQSKCMDVDDPLAVLADVARYMVMSKRVSIVYYAPDCAALCHLFVELCFKAGCAAEELMCYFNNRPDLTLNCLHIEQGSMLGSVAVVTEKTNMESAVSAVVVATGDPKYPWRLSRIIVQECVYERFKRTLQNKIKRENLHTPPPPERLTSQADLLLVYENKTFLIDYVGTLSDDEILKESYVQIEAYRTTKELLSLLNVYQPPYLSLWCSDVSTSNEIAFGVKPCTVWLNDFGVFEGPKDIGEGFKMHQARINGFRSRNILEKKSAHPLLAQFMKLRADWIKKDVQYRREAVSKALKKYLSGDNVPHVEEVTEVLKFISDVEENISFTHVQNGRLCIGIYEPRGLVHFRCYENIFFRYKGISELFKSVILGNGVLLGLLWPVEPKPAFMHMCAEEGVPIKEVDFNVDCKGFDISSAKIHDTGITLSEILYRKRVILSHFGETFAN